MREFYEGTSRIARRCEPKQGMAPKELDQEENWEIQDTLLQPIQTDHELKELKKKIG
jgi:hypothetical protein